MRFSLFASCALFLMASCSPGPYKGFKKQTATISREALTPQFGREIYRCTVDGKIPFKKFHLSGILYLKNLRDSTTRVLFQSEMGMTFFDFGWDARDSFTVHSITPQMNKEGLIKTLRKDFELLMLRKHLISSEHSDTALSSGDTNSDQGTYFRFPLYKGYAYYVLDNSGRWKGIENADDKRKVTIMTFAPPVALHNLPEHISIRHLRAGFTIDLKKIHPDAE
jgi:hypothetical protein